MENEVEEKLKLYDSMDEIGKRWAYKFILDQWVTLKRKTEPLAGPIVMCAYGPHVDCPENAKMLRAAIRDGGFMPLSEIEKFEAISGDAK